MIGFVLIKVQVKNFGSAQSVVYFLPESSNILHGKFSGGTFSRHKRQPDFELLDHYVSFHSTYISLLM